MDPKAKMPAGDPSTPRRSSSDPSLTDEHAQGQRLIQETRQADADGAHGLGASPAPSRHQRRRRFGASITVLVVVAGLVALFGFGLTRDPTLIRSPLVGRRAPDFALRMMEGSRLLRLSDLRGQVVVLNFWASWCTACRQEHPNFVAAWQLYRDQGVVFVGVIFEDTPEAAARYMQELGGDWPNLVDPGSKTALEYGVYGVPETFFIGPDGVIAYKQIGYPSYDLLTGEIKTLLRQAPT